MFDEFGGELVEGRILLGQLDADLEHVLAEKSHPRGAVCLFEITSGRQRSAAIEHTDVVEAEESALEYVPAVTIFAVDPPGEVEHQLAKDPRQKISVSFSTLRLLRAIQVEGSPGVHGRIHIAEV